VRALRAERALIAVPNPNELALWRERHTALVAKRWTTSARAALQDRLGSRWRWVQSRSDAATRTFALRAVAPESLPWSGIVAMLAGLEATPGATVEAVTIATAGTRTARNFATVEMHVRFQWAEAGTLNTVPPESVRRDRVLLGPGWSERAAEGRARCGRSLPSASALHRASALLRQTGFGLRLPSGLHSARPDHPRRVRSRSNLSQPQPT